MTTKVLVDYYCIIFNLYQNRFLVSEMKESYNIREAKQFFPKEEAEKFKNSLPNKDNLEVREICVEMIVKNDD